MRLDSPWRTCCDAGMAGEISIPRALSSEAGFCKLTAIPARMSDDSRAGIGRRVRAAFGFPDHRGDLPVASRLAALRRLERSGRIALPVPGGRHRRARTRGRARRRAAAGVWRADGFGASARRPPSRGPPGAISRRLVAWPARGLSVRPGDAVAGGAGRMDRPGRGRARALPRARDLAGPVPGPSFGFGEELGVEAAWHGGAAGLRRLRGGVRGEPRPDGDPCRPGAFRVLLSRGRPGTGLTRRAGPGTGPGRRRLAMRGWRAGRCRARGSRRGRGRGRSSAPRPETRRQ